MIKAIFFDWGGTLTYGSIFGLVAARLAHVLPVSKRRIAEALEKKNHDYLTGKVSSQTFWTAFADTLGIHLQLQLFNRILLEAGEVNKEMLTLVDEVRKHYHVGLLSDNYKELAVHIVKKYHLHKRFDVLVFSQELGFKKPDPRIYRIACRKLRIKPEECVFLDDKHKNILGARRVGMKGIHFKSVGQARLALRRLNIQVARSV
ncbi:MAG: HAD family phosphatase [Nanoarchaeota archaeon]|nr:HAD family phosphatase [Nanoarchaeota archaeon]